MYMKKETFKIIGMHCTSCAMNIDGELEDTPGIACSTTHYAKQETIVEYTSENINSEKIIEIIKSVGYDAVLKE